MYKNISTANTLEVLLLIKSQLDLEEVNENITVYFIFMVYLFGMLD